MNDMLKYWCGKIVRRLFAMAGAALITTSAVAWLLANGAITVEQIKAWADMTGDLIGGIVFVLVSFGLSALKDWMEKRKKV